MITASNDGIYIDLHVQPGARRAGVRGVHGDRLKLAVSKPAEGGRANADVVQQVATMLKVKPASVVLVSGRSSREKRLHVSGINYEQARALIESAIASR